MRLRAYAKINIGLDVKGKRDDGYHELDMIMAPINFYDEIDIEVAEKMSLTSNQRYIDSNPDNSILKTVKVMRERYGFKENFDIKLKKHIPTQGGLAGGSADAAAIIKGIKSLLDIPMTLDDMRDICLKIGSDEYFCLLGKVARVSGTGEIIEPFTNGIKMGILLVKPWHGVSTKAAFEKLDLANCDHPDIGKIKRALVEDNYDLLCHSIGNSLEEPSFKIRPEIKKAKEKLLRYGMDAALMSGSGSTVFGITQNTRKLDEVMDIMKQQRYFVRKVHIYEDPLII